MKTSFHKTAIVASIAMLGVAASGVASAVDIGATATVQNALTVVKVTDLNMGTIFATTAAAGGYRYLTLAPATSAVTAGAGPVTTGVGTVLSLGGAAAAEATIAVGGTTPVNVVLPTQAAAAALGTATAAQMVTYAGGSPIYLQLADPAVAKFMLMEFTAGGVTGGTNTGTASVPILTPSFGSTSLSFKIGASVATDVLGSGATRTAYQNGNYTATFPVTANY